MHTTVDVGSARLYVEQHGSGPDLVMLHGRGHSSAAVWDGVVPALARHFRVTIYDQRGHFRSAAGDGASDQSVARHADDLRLLKDALGIERCHLLGFSFGGLVVQEFALAHPERVQSLILACTTCGVKPHLFADYLDRADLIEREGLAAFAEKTIARVLSPAFMAAHPDRVATYRRDFLADNAKSYAAAMRAIVAWNACERIGALKCPVLVLGGAEDDTPMSAMQAGAAARELQRLIPGAQLQLIPGVRHYIQMETPENFVAALESFFAGASKR